MMRLIFSLVVMHLLSVTAAAQGTSMSIAFDQHAKPLSLGQPFTVTIQREWPPGTVPAPWNPESMAPLTVVSQELRVEVQAGSSKNIETISVTCMAFTSGEVVVAPVRFSAMPEGVGRELVSFSEALRLDVQSPIDPNAPGELEGPGPLMDAPTAFGVWLPGVAACLLAGALGFGGWRLMTKDRRPTTQPTLDPRLSAIAALDAFNPESDGAADALTLIIRRYLFALVGKHTLSQTPDELQSEGANQILVDSLRRLEAVRFAESNLSLAEYRSLQSALLDCFRATADERSAPC